MAKRTAKPRNRNRYPDAKLGPTRAVSYGYVGRYASGRLGWLCPEFLNGQKDRPDYLSLSQSTIWRDGPGGPQPFYLCRITVEMVPGARVRWVRKPSGDHGGGNEGKETT